MSHENAVRSKQIGQWANLIIITNMFSVILETCGGKWMSHVEVKNWAAVKS